MILTEHQNEKLNESLEILKRENFLLIKGSAGVGKTTLVEKLIEGCIEENIVKKFPIICCSAPTNKAVIVLKNKIKNKYNFQTIHSALCLKRYINKKGEISFRPNLYGDKTPLEGVNLLIVDEASMLDTDLLGFIEEHSNRRKCKVIFLGDNKQINPVGEEESPVFFKNYEEVELTEIVRQGEGNPIIELSNNLQIINLCSNNLIEDKGYVHTKDQDRVIETLAKVNGTDEYKYLAWTNKEVDYINKKVREHIYISPKKIEKGESIILNSPYEDFFTNQELTVEDVSVKDLTFTKKIESEEVSGQLDTISTKINCYMVKVKGSNTMLIIIHEDSENSFKKLKNSLYKAATRSLIKWTEYYRFVESFTDFKYNHALSVHKSQGSTYKKVFVNVGNINLNKSIKEKNRLMYTAVTRASDLVILYNS